MSLTKGQIESFSLIAMNAYGCQYAKFTQMGFKGYTSQDDENKFYIISQLIDSIWLYDPAITTNCITLTEVTAIMNKLMDLLCFTFNLKDLPETNLN